MRHSYALVATFSVLACAAPNPGHVLSGFSVTHPGWTGSGIYTPPDPKPTWNRPHNYTKTWKPTSTITAPGCTTGTAGATGTAGTSGNGTSSISGSSPTGTNAACASVSVLAASQTSLSPKATPTVPAELAYECLKSIPFNQSAAVDLLDAIEPYVQWQTTLEYVRDPPAEYAQYVQAPYDFYATWEAIRANTSAGAYESEYDFGWTLYRLFQLTHDGHFVFIPDSVGLIFNFARLTPLVSVSIDGSSVPEVYVYADVLAASYGNASFTPSPLTQIDGQDAIEYLLVWSEYGSLQDPDALWNNLFYIPAQVALGSSGTGTGTFSGGGRGRWVYPDPSTTLTFANGTSVTYDNFAKVLQPFDGINSGADIYSEFFDVPEEAYQNIFEVAASTTSAAVTSTTAAATSTSSAAATPRPAYPSPVVVQDNNLNSGYFLEGEGYDDVAVLALNSFVGLGSAEVQFQDVNSELIAAALANNKTKLIIDVSANGGGTILQGYDMFKQLFPSILPYGATRFRAQEALNLIGEQDSYLAGLYPRSMSENGTVQDIESAVFNYRTDADVNYQPFTSWAEKYNPKPFGPEPDNFTSIIRWNLSDVLTPDNSGGIYVSGYLNRSNVTTQPFARDNIIVIYDGYCASTCTIFSELMRQQAGVKTIALGGRPNLNITQAVGGVKGTNDFPYDYVFDSAVEILSLSNDSLTTYWEQTVLANYTQLPIYRSTDAVFNARDGIRQGDAAETPLQFYYEPADCRILYTPQMVVDETALWKTVADTVWNGGNACVAGSNQFYGTNGTNAVRKRAGLNKRHEVRRDLNVAEIYDSLSVGTGNDGFEGDGYMLL